MAQLPPDTETVSMPPSPQPSSRQWAHWTTLEKVLTLATALITLLGAILGVVTVRASQARDDAETTVVDQRDEVRALTRQLQSAKAATDSLETVNEDQAARITDLEAQLDQSGSSSTESSNATIRNKGQVILNGNTGFLQLDAENDSTWGMREEPGISYVWIDVGDVLVFTGAQGVAMGTSVTGYNECLSAQGYESQFSIAINSLRLRQYLCAYTEAKTYISLRVVKKEGQNLTLDVTSYNPPS